MDPVTRIVHAGQEVDSAWGSLTCPIYQTSTFRFEAPGETTGFEYSRLGNPTRRALEALLAELEGGAGCVATATGMAAISTLLATFPAGSHVICCHDCYGGTARLLSLLQHQGCIELSFADLADADALARACRNNTRLVWAESPSNPLLRVLDLPALARRAHALGLLLAVDNTFLSPLGQKPIALGADAVVHSTTKYLNGHADVVGGAVIAADRELDQRVQYAAKAHGGVAAPFDCWLVLRGMKTLALRMARHEANALAVARFLASHPAVARVHYPGLPDDPGHALASRQQSGYGGMVTFALRGGAEAARRVLGATRMFALAESLGGVESLIGHPATMSHAAMSAEQRAVAGIGDDLLRLSVGIEAEADLLADLERALQAAA